jgi:hypothetical protein
VRTNGGIFILEKGEAIVLGAKAIGKGFFSVREAEDVHENRKEECHLKCMQHDGKIHFIYRKKKN